MSAVPARQQHLLVLRWHQGDAPSEKSKHEQDGDCGLCWARFGRCPQLGFTCILCRTISAYMNGCHVESHRLAVRLGVGASECRCGRTRHGRPRASLCALVLPALLKSVAHCAQEAEHNTRDEPALKRTWLELAFPTFRALPNA